MYAQALLFVILMGKLFRKLFFGQLRAAEFEVCKLVVVLSKLLLLENVTVLSL